MVSVPEPGQWAAMLRCQVIHTPASWTSVNESTHSTALPEYGEFVAALQRCGAAHSPAEAHGFAVGLQLAGVEGPLDLWQHELYSDFDPSDALASECRALLDRLFAEVFAAADPASEGFTLLLPQDIVVDTRRLGAVRDWCQGFLYGIGLGGDGVINQASPQMRDLLRDIAEITRLATDDVENSSENQSALIEIEEFLRVGVLLLREERLAEKVNHDAK